MGSQPMYWLHIVCLLGPSNTTHIWCDALWKKLTMNMLQTILGEKDNRNAKVDLQDLSVCEELWLKPHPTKSGETRMP